MSCFGPLVTPRGQLHSFIPYLRKSRFGAEQNIFYEERSMLASDVLQSLISLLQNIHCGMLEYTLVHA